MGCISDGDTHTLYYSSLSLSLSLSLSHTHSLSLSLSLSLTHTHTHTHTHNHRRAPALFQKDPGHLLRLFKVLAEPADRDVGLSVQECMGLLAPVYRGAGGQAALLLEATLLENIYHVSLRERWVAWGLKFNPPLFSQTTHQVRLMSAVLACTLFPFNHIPSRFVSMVACGDR